jgi:actin-like ATPase involved in cell morphogenesis
VHVSENDGIFGIDLGTTYSVVAYIDETGWPVVARNSYGDDTTPSVVFFESETNVVVGKVARESAGVFPDRVVSLIKREMGSNDYSRTFFGAEHTPPSISALILGALAKDAAEATQRSMHEVVITVPAYFGLLEKDATKKAGEIAGLNVIGIVPEPVAAALHYGVTGTAEGTTFLVYDLGGATFDISLIKMTEETIEVLAVGGNQMLGGADWDEKLFDYIVEQTIEQVGDDSIMDDEGVLQELRLLAENTKRALSKGESKTVIHRLTGTAVKIIVTRELFEEMTADLLEETIRITNRTLDEAEQRYPRIRTQINKLLLAGGSCCMPAVAERLKQEYPWIPKLADPDLAIAKGAALYAAGQTVHPAPGPVTPEAVKAVAERTGLDAEQAGSIASVFPMIEAAVLSSALVPFVQALAARTADDVYASLRRLLPRRRPRKDKSAQSATGMVSVADEYTKLVLLLPASLNDEMQESLHRLLENQARRPASPRDRWLQISRASAKTSTWNVELIDEVPADCVILENLTTHHDYPRDPQTANQKDYSSEYREHVAHLEQERKLLREMVKYLAAEINPNK